MDEGDKGSVGRVMRDYTEICVDDDSPAAILIKAKTCQRNDREFHVEREPEGDG